MAAKGYAVFKSWGDGDGWATFDLIAVALTRDAATRVTKEAIGKAELAGATSTYSASDCSEVHWCKRSDLPRELNYNTSSGYVVEELELLE